MKTVVCYGDSNTWGYRPDSGRRYDHNQRWTRRLQALLGDGFWLVEEGQNGRTTLHDDPVEGQKNGLAYLVPCLESHKPVDLVLLMLGTNDLKQRFAMSADDIAGCVKRLVRVIQSCEFGPADGAPEVLLLAPPPLARLSGFAEMFSGGYEKSLRLGGAYRQVAAERGCHFMDTREVVSLSDLDGVHLDPDQLPLLAEALAGEVRRIV